VTGDDEQEKGGNGEGEIGGSFAKHPRFSPSPFHRISISLRSLRFVAMSPLLPFLEALRLALARY